MLSEWVCAVVGRFVCQGGEYVGARKKGHCALRDNCFPWETTLVRMVPQEAGVCCILCRGM